MNEKYIAIRNDYKGVIFDNLTWEPIVYDGKEYRSWWIDVGGRIVKFAEQALLDKFIEDYDGEVNINNDIDDSIGYYARLDQTIESAIIDYDA